MSQSDLSRCPICPGTNRCVLGDGPIDAAIMCVGEEPGRDEDIQGRPFIGQAGKEFNLNYLNLAGLKRSLYDPLDSDVYVTNARKCRQHQNKTPTYSEMIGCANYFMPDELRLVNPTVVILMGASACKLLGEGAIDLEAEHGIPRWGTLYEWDGWIVPINHPAAGLHDGAMMTPMLEDWTRLGPWLRDGTWSWAEDTLERDYVLCRTPQAIQYYFKTHGAHQGGERPLLGLDTETHARVRWSIQVSSQVGSGLMIQTDTGEFDPELIQELRYQIAPYELALHNAEADLWATELMDLPNLQYRDTMQEAYQFQNMSQKLKVISRRTLGRIRHSWDELVTPYSKEVLHEWMGRGILHAEEHWRTITPRAHKKTGKALKPDVKKSVAESLLFELDGYMLNNPDYPVWQKLKERMPEAWLERLIASLGPIPAKGIAHVPLEDAVYYGCSDADDTLAIALVFDRMREEFKTKLAVVEDDRDRLVSPYLYEWRAYP